MTTPQSQTQPPNTPEIDATPPHINTELLSGTLIPETPPNEEITVEQALEISNMTKLLVLLNEAISDISSIKTSGVNATFVGQAKSRLESAKTIARNLLEDEEKEKQHTMELMSKDLKDIKTLLEKPTYSQIAATAPPIKPKITEDKIKKQQREKLAITITATAAQDTIKNQLKTMHAKDIIQKCQSTITECFKEGHVPKIHGINKLSNDEYRLHCESKEDPQLLSKMDWSLAFIGVKSKRRKYGLVIHGVHKKDLDPTTEDEATLRNEIEKENASRNLHVV